MWRWMRLFWVLRLNCHILKKVDSVSFRSSCMKTMKLFQQVRKIFQVLGIHPIQHGENTRINVRNMLIAGSMGSGGVLTAAYCLFQAKTVKEYGDSFYAAVTDFLTTMYFLTLFWKMEKLVKLIEKYEEFIQKRIISNINWINFNEMCWYNCKSCFLGLKWLFQDFTIKFREKSMKKRVERLKKYPEWRIFL